MAEDPRTKHAAIYEQLKAVRTSKTVALKPCHMLRKEFVGLDGEVHQFSLRYYQVQAVYHFLAMKRMILGDATGVGKTISTLGGLCYAWEKEPDNRVIIVSPKSAMRQWAGEIEKFTTGIKIFIASGTPNERKQAYLEFALHEGPEKAVMLVTYAPLVRDWGAGAHQPLLPNGQPDTKAPMIPGMLEKIVSKIKHPLTVVYDEATAFKNDRTKTWAVCSALSNAANRCYGLTATLLKNNLIEGFSIYKVIYPQVFTSKYAFMQEYCVTKLQAVPGKTRKIPIIVGYKNLGGYRERIDPFFLGRPKHEISDELPTLLTREVKIELTPAEDAKYAEALTGVLSLGDGEVKDYSTTKTLTALIYCQQTVDSLSLLRFQGGDEIDTAGDALGLTGTGLAPVKERGSKEQALLDLLTEDFDDEKVIVYCRFASLIPRLQMLCKEEKIESVAITGQVVDTNKNPARRRAQEQFQDPKSKVRVVFISDAGSEAINLQAASAMIFYNSPWSWGGYVQLLGRPIRIGSVHDKVVAVHLVAERPGKSEKTRSTIDHYTLAALQKKKSLIDQVLGQSAVGALEFEADESFTVQLTNSLKGSR